LSEPKKFRAALVQMRTGRDVIGNIDAAARLVREAKSLGADYVQTPEQTSLMELDRASLFAHIVEEERDPALAAFQELARELEIHLHVGSGQSRRDGPRHPRVAMRAMSWCSTWTRCAGMLRWIPSSCRMWGVLPRRPSPSIGPIPRAPTPYLRYRR
jgi:predicted amidohydrolase